MCIRDRYLGAQFAADWRDKIWARYGGGVFSLPVAGADLTRKSTLQLRNSILHGVHSPFVSLFKNSKHPVSLPNLIDKHYAGDAVQLQTPVTDANAIRQGATFGVAIACHNNADTIVGAVLSCLNQTLPFDEIVVVDRKSSDKSVILVEELAQRYSLSLIHI